MKSAECAELPANYTLDALAAHTRLEQPSPLEQHSRWDLDGYRGWEVATSLRSGMSLSASSCRWGEQLGAIVVDHAPSELNFIVSRGPGMRANLLRSGEAHLVGGGALQVCQVQRPVRIRYDSCADAHDETVCLELTAERLKELMGAEALPASLQRVVSNQLAYGIESQEMTPELFRLLDEILYCDASGPSRQLYLEGKGLELLALLIDRLEETERASSSRLSQTDVDRLQLARQILLARLETPPSLPELARRAGLNEAKLKAGFRTLFGNSVFGYLRQQRMEEARRLLRARNYNVTEVAARVGYSNPSKFAAAFRKQFGISPSAGAKS